MALRRLDSAIVAGLQILGTGLSAVTVVVLAGMLGAEDYGRYVYHLTAASVLPLFLGLGGEHVFLMFASRKRRLVPSLFGNALAVRVTLTVVAALVIAIGLRVGRVEFARAILFLNIGALLAVFVNPLFLSLYRVQGVFTRPLLYAFTNPIFFIAYLAVASRGTLTFTSAAFGFMLSQVLTILIFVFDIGRIVRPRFSRLVLDAHLKPGAIFATSQVFDYASTRVDIFLLEYLLGPVAVGVYGAAQKVVSVFTVIPSSFHVVELPEFHRAAEVPAALLERFRRLRQTLIELALLCFGLLTVNASYVVDTVFTPEFRGAVPILFALSIGGLVVFVNYPYYMLAEAIKKIQQRLNAKVAAFVFTSVAIGALVRVAGIEGAAAGFVAGQVLFVGFLHHFTRSHNGGVRALLADARSLPLALVAGVVASAVNKAMAQSLATAILASVTYVAILIGVGALLGLNDARAAWASLTTELRRRAGREMPPPTAP